MLSSSNRSSKTSLFSLRRIPCPCRRREMDVHHVVRFKAAGTALAYSALFPWISDWGKIRLCLVPRDHGTNPKLPVRGQEGVDSRRQQQQQTHSVPTCTKRLVNHCKEYWYMGSTTLKSLTQKYMMAPRYATGRYPSRFRSISFSVTSASATCFGQITEE